MYVFPSTPSSALLSRFYIDIDSDSNTNTRVPRATLAFTFLFSLFYFTLLNSTLPAITAEIFPVVHLRSYGTGTAVFCHGVTGVWLGQVTPVAVEAVGWRCSGVFAGCLVALAGVYGVVLGETGRVGLEGVAGRFGDEVVGEERAKGERLWEMQA